MPTWAWIVIAVVVALVLLGALASAYRKKREEKHREHATEMRQDAERWGAKLDQREADAQALEADAARARAEAEELDAVARQRRMRVESERTKHDETLREADELDPDVDTDQTDHPKASGH